MPNVLCRGRPTRRYKNGPCVLLVEPETRRLLYRYRVTRELVMEFDLFCEVGAPFQRYYRELFAAHGLTVETVEVDEPPWIYDRLKARQPGDRCRSKRSAT